MPKLSVIVPVYNGEKYLNQCVDSILAQEFTDFELILVDDGSTDASLEICHGYEQKDSRVVVVHKENAGLVAARKSGISVSKGEYVGFIDCDDYIDSNMYSDMINTAVKDNSDIVVSNIIVEYTDKTRIMRNYLPAGFYSREDIKNTVIPRMLIHSGFVNYGIIPGVVIKIFRREILEKALPNVCDSISTGEDVAITAYSMMQAKSISIIDTAAYHYIQLEDSMIRKFNPERIEKIKALYSCLCNVENADYQKQIYPYMSFLVFNTIGECINKSGYDKKRMIKTLKEILNSDVAAKALENTDISSFSFENKIKIILMKYQLVRILILLLRR